MSFELDIQKCVEELNNGGIILYPTDTIWGLGCDATNEKAVKRIYHLKKREESKSMIILLANEAQLKNYTNNQNIRPMAEYNINKPLTIIYPEAKGLAKNVIAEDGTVAIRIANDAFCKELISAFGKPIVSTSANISGSASPRFYDEISEEIKSGAGYIALHRRNDVTPFTPSAIIKLLANGEFEIIRH